MRKALLLGLTVAFLAATPASAQSLTSFFNSAPLATLAQSQTILTLTAQSVSKVARADVNAFDDYSLINGPGTLRVHFNRQLQNLGQVSMKGWYGVAPYSNNDIVYDLQLGFDRVKAAYNMPAARAGNVTVYKTVNTGQIVYDYAVLKTATTCREYLFTPATGGIQLGFMVNCFKSLVARSSAGRPDRT